MTREPLILAAGTIATSDLVERIAAASGAGYTGLGLRPDDYDQASAARLGDAELRTRIADAGLRVIELQSVAGWAGAPEEFANAQTIEAGCYRIAEALGADYMMVGNTTLGCSWDEAVERFAAICARAADHGLDVALEFLPWGPIPDALTAWRLIEESEGANAGVLVDVWHHFRGANDWEQIRALPPDRIRAIQIDDAMPEIKGTLLEDTMAERRLPGQGFFDLVRFVRLLDDMGVTAPYSVEVLSDELRAMAPADAARVSAETTWAVLDEARARE